jgi:hypothetical protein
MPYSLEPHTSFMELYVRVGSVKVTRQYSITSVSVTHNSGTDEKVAFYQFCEQCMETK